MNSWTNTFEQFVESLFERNETIYDPDVLHEQQMLDEDEENLFI